VSTSTPLSDSRLARLFDLLKTDPDNASLIGAASMAAYDEGNTEAVDTLLKRHEAIQPLSADLLNLRGLVALSQSLYEEAIAAFDAAAALQADPTVLYNLAYAHAMAGQYERAVALADGSVLDSVPASVALKMRALHHLGRLDDVVALGHTHGDRPGADENVLGLMATALFDAGDMARARQYVARSPHTPDGCTVGGMLALDDGKEDQAIALFSQALTLNPRSSRAMLGQGLGLLAKGEFAPASKTLAEAAGLLGSHAGSWVAAGWASVLQPDLDRAQACFEQAMAADRGFSEAAGGLAIVYLRKNERKQAEHYAEVALRLDPASLSGALASSLLLAQDGDAHGAEETRQAALNLPLGPEGKTIARALARRAIRQSGA
jgi:tetratricopeptide (TPR) repeat protein